MFEKNQVGKPSVDKPWLKYYTKEQKNTPTTCSCISKRKRD